MGIVITITITTTIITTVIIITILDVEIEQCFIAKKLLRE